MNNQDRIRLAEAMGWKWSLRNVTYKTGQWTSPDGVESEVWCYHESLPFDPFTDANDCDAVIAKLNDEGYWFEMRLHWPAIGHFVTLHHIAAGKSGEWQGDDYKTGVCELALKVLGKSDEGVP